MVRLNRMLAVLVLAGITAIGTGTLVKAGGYSDASDGALIYDGIHTVLGVAPGNSFYNLPRDIYPSSMVVSSTVTVHVSGYRIIGGPASTLVNAGAICADGSAGGLGGYGMPGGAGGAGAPAHTIGGGASGGAGGAQSGPAGGLPGASLLFNALGGSGGSGAYPFGYSAGGAGGSAVASIGSDLTQHHPFSAMTGLSLPGNQFCGGAGGGGSGGLPGAGGGGGGGGAGCVVLDFYSIDNTAGTISANGGWGSLGPSVSGGGGGGGAMWINSHSFAGNTPTAAGGGCMSGAGTPPPSYGANGHVYLFQN